MRLLISCLAGAFISAGATVPVLGQTQAQAPSVQSARTVADPNEVVCEKQEVTGSRLASRRVCKTRAQWAEARQLDRQEVERAQTSRGLRGGN